MDHFALGRDDDTRHLLLDLSEVGVELLDRLVGRPAALDPALEAVLSADLLGELGLHLRQRGLAAGELFRVQSAVD